MTRISVLPVKRLTKILFRVPQKCYVSECEVKNISICTCLFHLLCICYSNSGLYFHIYYIIWQFIINVWTFMRLEGALNQVKYLLLFLSGWSIGRDVPIKATSNSNHGLESILARNKHGATAKFVLNLH